MLACCTPALAQYYQTGSAPAGVRWSRITGEHFDIIYPRETDSLARNYLYLFEKYREADLAGLKVGSPKVPIVLQPYDMYSNGSVVWAPKRVELYTTPPGNPLYALDWPTQLAVHEGRHIGQMAHYTNGIYKVLTTLLGEQGIAVGVGLYPTKMLLEGDAVQNETDLTGSGRGRNPEFLKFFRASFVDGDFRSYYAWRFGSYRQFTPDKYAMGYLLMSTMRDRSHNYTVTGDIMGTQVREWYRFFSVSNRAYQRATGLTQRKNWRSAVARNTELWSWEYKLRAPYTDFDPLLAVRYACFIEMANPVRLGDNTYATMSGVQYERRLMSIDSRGKLKWRHPLSRSTSALVADSDHSMIFSEIVPDPRWEHRSWSVLRRYDAAKNSFETLTRRTRYVNPVPSAGRDSILAVEPLVAGGTDVVVLDRKGNLLDRIPVPDKGQAVGVAQLGDDLYCSVITTEGMGLYRYGGGSWDTVIKPQTKMISSLRAAGDSLLYFVSDLDGLSNVYAMDPRSDQLWRVVSTRFSAADPSLTGDGNLLYAEYDRWGYQPVSTPFSELPRKKASFDQPYQNEQADRNAAQMLDYVTPATEEEDLRLKRSIDSLKSRPYNKLTHGIHIHSWFPFYANVDRLMNDFDGLDRDRFSNWHEYVAPGVTLVSQNNLGTLTGLAAYSWHRGHHAGHLQFRYSGLYPVLSASLDFNDRNRVHTQVGEGPRGRTDVRIDTLGSAALVFNSKISVPLNLSRGGWVTRVAPSIGYSFTNDAYSFPAPVGSSFSGGDNTHLLTAALSFYTELETPKSRVTPRLGTGFNLSGMMRLGPGVTSIAGLTAWAYLPGFGRDDGFKLTYSRQYQPEGYALYMPSYNLVRHPFGYSKEIMMDYHRALLEYALPIYGGDLDGGVFFYLKRIIVIPFVDWAYDRKHPVVADNHITDLVPTRFFSYGTALLYNGRLFRIGTDLQLGVRYARPHRPGDKGTFSFIVSTGL